MKHRRFKKPVHRVIEIAAVMAVTAAVFIICRRIGVQERGNTLLGGEIAAAAMIPAWWYGVKSIVRDVKGGLFR